jgi:uncharacterized membrane protein YecN with MAPEG domain
VEVSAAARAVALWAALLLLTLLGLSLAVVRQRQRHGVMFGDGAVPELAQAIRAFGNAAEYIPPGLIGLTVMAMVGAPALAVHAAGLTLFAGRAAHAAGLSRESGPSRLRSIGMVLTWVAYILVAVALFIFALG